jgi:ankyrin repeat protein
MTFRSGLLVVGAALLLFDQAVAGADPRLIEAVKRQDAAAVGAMLGKGVDVNVPEADGATALAWAAHRDHLEIARLLIKAGADANAANELGVTPLMLAAVNGSAPLVGLLLEAGADPSVARPSGETALMMAARAGRLDAVRLLLDRSVDVNAKTARGLTALMFAAAEGHAAVAQLLAERGADVQARAAVRTPPNRNYAGRQDSEVARAPRPVLKENEALNPEYRRDVLRARESPRAEGGFTPLLYATLGGSEATVRALLARGADVNATGPDGMSPLVLALVKKHEALANVLLESGADPNAAGTGYTALHVASATAQHAVLKTLLARGADPNAPLQKPVTFTEAFVTGTKVSPGAGWVDIVGATPFMMAARSVDAGAMRLLMAAGADPKKTALDGTTAVMLAAGLGKRADADIGYYTWDEQRAIEAITLGLESGIDINASNQDGETALHAAAYHAANGLVKFLVGKGANINATNWQQQTPLLVAQGHLVCCTTFVRHAETAALLRTLGADATAGRRLNFGLVNYVEDAPAGAKAQERR